MSTEPDGRWRPGFNEKYWWLASTIFLGLFGGLAFIVFGQRARRPDWWIPGIIYLVASWTTLILMVRETETGGDRFAKAFVAVWLISFVHALIIVVWMNVSADYRLLRAHQRGHQPAPLPPPPGGYRLVRPEWPAPGRAGGHPAPPPDLPAGLAPPPGDYYGPDPVAPPAPIDVNTAEARQLTTLPGFTPDRVRRVLAERRTRRGFGSIEEFAAAASLAPHEFVHVRELVVCTPRPPAPPTQGRILDV